VFGSGSNYTSWSSPTVLQLNQWNHVAYTFINPSSAATFYINGQSVSTNFTTNGTGAGENISTANINSWLISRLTNVAGTIVYYSNIISNLSLYNKSLSESEVSQNYNSGRYRFGV
jgi:hypothetical protein